MAVQVNADMERGFAQLYEIQKRFLNGSLSPLAARQPLQDIIEGKLAAATQFDRYHGYLLPLAEQLSRIIRFDNEFWGNQFAGVTVDTASDHIQSVDDLEILYVDFGSPEKTVEMWWKVLAGTQPNAWRWDGLKTDKKHLRPGHNTKQYEPGIHRIRINLVAHWEPQQGRTVLQVREQAASSGELLAHAEVLAAYGLHSELLQQMDGQKLPYADLAGFEATVSGHRPWRRVPYLDWRRSRREVKLNTYWYDYVDQSWAAPVVREL